MADLTPGTPAAIALQTAVRTAQLATWGVLTVDEAAINAINATAPTGALVADANMLLVAVIATGDLAKATQTMGYLNRAAINLGVAS